jgi:hypothetical protein
MKRAAMRTLVVSLTTAAGAIGLFGNDNASQISAGHWVATADAIIGRPLTPLSYAGVARRTTRRAVVAGAAVGAAAVAAPRVYAPGCVQAVNAYGQIYYRCR